jgi:hypothetical protein
VAYLTADEYEALTERPKTEATPARLDLASRMLDSRIGFRNRQVSGVYEGYKLDLGNLDAYEADAARRWVAAMVGSLADSGDRPPTGESIKLGRFSVSGGKDTAGLPSAMRYADFVLVDAGLVNPYPVSGSS